MTAGRRRTAVVVSTLATLAALAALLSAPSPTLAGPVARGACPVFPADNWWHADVSRLPVDPRSAAWLSVMSTQQGLHPDFGPGYGTPVTIVGGDHRRVRVAFRFARESDHTRYPLGPDTRIQRGRDHHVIVVDASRCRLYELFAVSHDSGGWRAGSGAVWSLRSNRLRPNGWTSADAAGLPILAGLLRWNEVRDDSIDHALRFTMPATSGGHVWPARHDARQTSPGGPPMGARFRLRSSFDASELSVYAQRVVAAMKTYGLVLADHGAPWHLQGMRDRHWPASLVHELGTIPASAFEAVDTGSLRVAINSGRVRTHARTASETP